MIEFIYVLAGGVVLVAALFVYINLVDKGRIKPHIPPRVKQTQRGNFWDAETKQFYKWDQLIELKKEKEEQNDTTQ